MWDAHCHLDDPRLAARLDDVISNARAAGIEGMLLASYGPSRWPTQLDIARQHHDVYVTLGVHPWAQAALPQAEDALLAALDEATTACEGDEDLRDSLVGLGELGLDKSSRMALTPEGWERQVRLCRGQLAMARARDLPVVLHVVQAHGDMLTLLRDDGLPQAGGMVHGFSGSLGLAEAYIQQGLHISFGGRITHQRARKARDAAASLPDRWLLCETDAPDMAPAQASSDVNEPANLPLIIDALADLRAQPPEAIAALTAENAKRLFRLA